MTKRALVADDDPEQLFLIANVLRQAGLDVVQATSGHSLLEQVAAHDEFDLVITDVSMPEMTGVEAMRCARNGGHLGPVIVTTALRDDALVNEVASIGGRALLLYKPFSLATLRAVVSAALASSA